MDKKDIKNEIKTVALAMFRKNFLGIFHGSISAKTQKDRIIINKKEAIFDELYDEKLIEISSKKDYHWEEASIDSSIHFGIYKNIHEAKFICYTMPPYITSYALTHDLIIPKDYFGSQMFETIDVYDPKHFDDWYERADIEIPRALKDKKTNIIVIRGYGVYTYARDMFQIAKSIAILENSCKILHYTKQQGHLIH